MNEEDEQLTPDMPPLKVAPWQFLQEDGSVRNDDEWEAIQAEGCLPEESTVTRALFDLPQPQSRAVVIIMNSNLMGLPYL